jgi:hypothetical protein
VEVGTTNLTNQANEEKRWGTTDGTEVTELGGAECAAVMKEGEIGICWDLRVSGAMREMQQDFS